MKKKPPPAPCLAPPTVPAPRGRPPSITRARIAQAGMAIGLPHITFTGVAAALGVSHMALYKHVPSLVALKQLVAEEIFARWQLPEVDEQGRQGLRDYLQTFSSAARAFVREHPGLTPYVLRRQAATPAMLDKINAHHQHIARVYGLRPAQARWLLSTVAFHCIAVSDTVYSLACAPPHPDEPEDLVSASARAHQQAEMEAELEQGMQALIVGALALLEEKKD
ncbi:TetR/AcrR family transcriptional regulator [Vandammella animalimorsus]|uniref:TetR/AcrR family transcriptional regulator n=1 Tax=Vandammella animalimorsus TaxID=2029117 RepID=UPI0026F9B477|nr:TetR/AcrR family transcriptional regulator [Comamonadaceae bacterium]